MTRLATSLVLGYHGCDRDIADLVIRNRLSLIPSRNNFDWLGPGLYFWEDDPQRALEWAEDRVQRGMYAHAGVIGAVIDLNNCLNLASRQDIELVQAAHQSFIRGQELAKLPLPKNKPARGNPRDDVPLRYLDNAVFRHLHEIVESDESLGAFDTVRGTFPEGEAVYPGCGFKTHTHVQIAVRNQTSIRGYFHPKDILASRG